MIWQGTGIAGTSEIAPTPVTTQPATFTYSVSQKAGSCTSPPSTIVFTVRKTPDAPKVVSPTAYCIGQNNSPLTAAADGQLTWYTNPDHSGSSFSQIVPNTQQANVTTYYVTQTDAFKCESPNSIVEVRVAEKATARLTGDGEIYPGDSTAIRVRLTGDGPWKFTDWNNKQVTTSDSLYVIWEKPKATRTYTITNLASSCGVGEIKNNYTIVVRTPLATQIVTEPVLVKVYPNPTNGDLFIEWSSESKQLISLQIVNVNGIVVKEISRQSTSVLQTEILNISNSPTGTYFLRVKTAQNGISTRTVLKK
ncbi:hypothetical protein GCM10028773_58550 [Spirosoma koreense]